MRLAASSCAVVADLGEQAPCGDGISGQVDAVALIDRWPALPCLAREVDRAACALGETPASPGLACSPAREAGIDDRLYPLGRLLDCLVGSQAGAALD